MGISLYLPDDKENVLLILNVLFHHASESVNKVNCCVNSLTAALVGFWSGMALLVGNVILSAGHRVQCLDPVQLCVSSKFRGV